MVNDRTLGRTAAYAALTLLVCGAGPVNAQTAAPEPPSPPVESPTSEPQSELRFPVLAYKVVGNTVLDNAEIEDAIMPFMGPGKTQGDVENARAALEKIYTGKGFATVAVVVPDQSVGNGVIRLEVVEQPLGQLAVAGNKYNTKERVLRGVPSLRPGVVPNVADVQRDMIALSRTRDRLVTPEIRQGAVPRTVDVTLSVEDKLPLHSTLELNNRSSVGTSDLRLAGSVEYDDLWGRGDQIQIATQFAPRRPDDSLVLSGAYVARVPGSNATLRLSGIYSNSNVTTIGSTNVLGRGYIFGARAAIPLPSRTGLDRSLAIGVDYKSFRDETALNLSPGDPEYVRNNCAANPGKAVCRTSSVTPVRYLPVTLAYRSSWSGEKAITDLDVELTFAFRGIGTDQPGFDLKRFEAKPNFWYLRAALARMQTYDEDYQLSFRVQGQFARDPLISNEGFSVGGADSVRGYFEAESLGDIGISSQTEFVTPKIILPGLSKLLDLRAHVFSDNGYTYIYQALPGQTARYWLVSTGLGLRARLFDSLSGIIDVAWPLIDGPTTFRDRVPNILFRLGVDL